MILDLVVVVRYLNHRGAIEDDSIVVLHRGVFRVCNFNTSTCERVDLTLNELAVIFFCTFVKECADDLCPFIVHHLDVEHRTVKKC